MRQEAQKIVNFSKLRQIHLYDLPTLHRICGSRMSAPNLETGEIRGCWSLMRLSGNTTKRPKLDCEKDWWDNLEWDGVEANHDHSLIQADPLKVLQGPTVKTPSTQVINPFHELMLL